MGVTFLRAGQKVQIHGQVETVLRNVDADIWQLESERTRRITEYSTATLMTLYCDRTLIFLDDKWLANPAQKGARLPEATDEQLELAKLRRLLVLEVINMPATKAHIAPIIEQKWRKLGRQDKCPSASRVLVWKKRFVESNRDIYSLIDQHSKKGNRKPRYPEEVSSIVEDAINEVYLTRERKTRQDALDEAEHRIRKENSDRPRQHQLPMPTAGLVRTLIDRIPAFDRVSKRFGRVAAERKFRGVLHNASGTAPLERVEIDHTQLDLMVFDEEVCLPRGRPWLTVCLDSYTRCVLGIHLTFQKPSYVSVAQCLRHAFLPKPDYREEYPSIENLWVPFGVMEELVVDNGMEFHSKSLENVCLSLGTELIYCARKKPWYKGKVERFAKSMNNDTAHGNPGTTFSNIFEKDDYDPKKHAFISFGGLKEIIFKWVVDIYHQRPHRALDTSPRILWDSSIAPQDIPIPTDPLVLNALMGRTDTRKLTHQGIELDKLFYNSPELIQLRRRFGHRLDVELRIDDENLGELIVICPKTGQLYAAPAINAEYAAGLSRWQHELLKRFATAKYSSVDKESLLRAKHDLTEIVEREVLSNKKKARAQAARIKDRSGRGANRQRRPNPMNADAPAEGKKADSPSSSDNSPEATAALPMPEQIPFRRITPVVAQRVTRSEIGA